MFPYANELTPFETDRSRELLQTAGILNIRDCISSYIPVFRWNKIEIVLQLSLTRIYLWFRWNFTKTKVYG